MSGYKTRLVLLAGTIVVLAVGVVGAWVWQAQSAPMHEPVADAQTVNETAVPGAESAHTPATIGRRDSVPDPDSHAAPPRAPAAPLPAGSNASALEDLEQRAGNGSLPAMRRLVQIYRLCPNRERFEQHPPNEVATEITKKYGEDPVLKGADKDDVQAVKQGYREGIRRLCADFPEMDRRQARRSFWRWLQMAADAGDTTAMINYAGNVIRAWPAPEGDLGPGRVSPLAHIESIMRYRERAIGYLDTARQRGNPASLLMLSQQYAAGGLFQIDLVKSCAYILAFRSTSAMQSPMNRQSSWMLLSQIQAELDPAEMARARAMAAQIESGFVEQIGGYP